MLRFIVILLVPSLLWSETIFGRVVKISDGDTIIVLSNSIEYKIRMSGIDSPEKKQFYGQESNNFLAGLIYRRQVTVEMEGRDKYKRYLGKVYLKEKDINLEMIKSGFAWHYKKYSTNSGYSDSEKLAQENKLGLWNYENPIAPWNYRKKKFMRRVNL